MQGSTLFERLAAREGSASKMRSSPVGGFFETRRLPVKTSSRRNSKFVSEVLLCFGEIELIDQEKLVPTAVPELADQKRV